MKTIAAASIAALVFQYSSATAMASQLDSIDIPLGGTILEVFADNADARDLSLSLNSTFKVPAIDSSKFSLSAISFSLTDTLGGAAWTPLGTGEYFTAFVTARETLTGPDSNTLYSATQPGVMLDVTSFGSVTTLQSTPLNQNVPNPSFFETGSGFVSGGTTPLHVVLSVDAHGDAYIPHLLAFLTHPILHVTYQFDPLVQNFSMSDLPASPMLAPFSVVTFRNSNDPIPPSLDLPVYVTPPEPAGAAMLVSAACTLAASRLLRRHRRDP